MAFWAIIEQSLSGASNNGKPKSVDVPKFMDDALNGNTEGVKQAVAAGADVNATDTGEGFTALMHAAAEGQLEVVKILLQHNADRNRRDIDGDTAQRFAEKNGHTEVVQTLSK